MRIPDGEPLFCPDDYYVGDYNGEFVSIGHLAEPVTFQPCDNEPTVYSGLLTTLTPILFTITGPATHALIYAMTGMPGFYRPHCPALPAGESADRLALPWGDSAYTSAVYQRHPTEWWPVLNWCLGPIESGLSPSSEGPRRRDEAEARVIGRMAERARVKRIDRLLAFWGADDYPEEGSTP